MAVAVSGFLGHTPNTAGTFRKELRKKKKPETLSELFLGIPLESTAGIHQSLYFKAFPVRLGTPLFSEVVPERPLAPGNPSSSEGISDFCRGFSGKIRERSRENVPESRVSGTRVDISLTSYRIEKRRNPENWRNRQNPIFCLFFSYFSYFGPMFSNFLDFWVFLFCSWSTRCQHKKMQTSPSASNIVPTFCEGFFVSKTGGTTFF